MSNLTDLMEVRLLDYVTRGNTPAALTAPIRIQLLSALGSGDTPGTPVTAAGATQTLGATAPSSGPGTNSNAAILRFDGLPNPTTVAGYRIIDSSATPVVTVDNIARINDAAAPEVITVTSGIYEVPAGGIAFTAA